MIFHGPIKHGRFVQRLSLDSGMILSMDEGKNQYKIYQKSVKCAICGRDNAQPYYQIPARDFLARQPGARIDDVNVTATLVKCQECGLVYVNPRWVFPDGLMPYDEEAEEEYFTSTYPERKRAYKELVDQLPGQLRGRVKTILDVGCGDGVLLDVCQEAGIHCEGVDISPSLVEKLRHRFGKSVIHDNGLASIASESFDVVFLINVIEHIEDPVAMLEQIYRVLRTGGIVLIHAPNFGGLPARIKGPRWHQIAPLVHLYYFTPSTIKKTINKAGFAFDGKFYIASSLWYKRVIQRVVYALGIQLDNGLGVVARRPVDQKPD